MKDSDEAHAQRIEQIQDGPHLPTYDDYTNLPADTYLLSLQDDLRTGTTFGMSGYTILLIYNQYDLYTAYIRETTLITEEHSSVHLRYLAKSFDCKQMWFES